MSLKSLLRKIVIRRIENNIRKKAIIGNDVQFATSSVVTNTGNKDYVMIGNHGCCFGIFLALCGGKISVGDHFYIGSGTCIQSKERVDIGNQVIISNNVLIVDNNNHPVSPKERRELSLCKDYMTDERWTWKYADSKRVVIEDNVWIGRNAVIMKGVTVGRGAIVALGAVVTHDVPPYTVVAGNPAKVVKQLERGDQIEED